MDNVRSFQYSLFTQSQKEELCLSYLGQHSITILWYAEDPALGHSFIIIIVTFFSRTAPFSPRCSTTSPATPQKLLSNWKRVELKMLDFIDCSQTWPILAYCNRISMPHMCQHGFVAFIGINKQPLYFVITCRYTASVLVICVGKSKYRPGWTPDRTSNF